ncbi:MAG: hypothetical protein IT368_12010 [Candidatus Hydrogenedentes bacterium]|nr:hypothetical protein [Candidatus Hydrogenedentota bacterium]
MIFAVLHIALAGLFEVHEFQLPEVPLQVFVAPGDDAASLELFVLEPDRMHVYYDVNPKLHRVIPLPSDTTAVDIFDLNNDGVWEMLAVAGQDIYSFDLDPEPQSPGGEVLFRQATTLGTPTGLPFLHVMGIEWKGQRVIGLPTEESYQLHRRTGEIAAAFAIGIDAPHRAHLRPFNSWVITPPQVAPPAGIEIRVSRIHEVEPQLPDELLPLETWGPLYRAQSDLRAGQAYHAQVERWPFFPLVRQGDDFNRAYFAFDDTRHQNTVVRIQQRDDARGEVNLSPPRRYPGYVLEAAAASPPDFNGDGYADLALWQTPEPAPTLGTLTRTAMRGNWPVRVTAHLYDPMHKLFSAKAASAVKIDVPLAAFLGGWGHVPVEHLLLDDFNLDGETDLAIMPDPERFLVWSYGESGFENGGGDNEMHFDQPVEDLVFSGRLGEERGYGIGLQAQDRLFLLESPYPIANVP